MTVLAAALVAAACGDAGSPEAGGSATTTGAPAASTTSAPVRPTLPDDPSPQGDPALDALCAGLEIAIGSGDDQQFASLSRALAAAVAESDSGTPEQRRVVTALLQPGAGGEADAERAAEAFRLLADDFGIASCRDVLAVIGLEPTTADADKTLAALAVARDAWVANGHGSGDYTLVMFVESSAWFGVSDGPDDEGQICGIFGELIVLVSNREVLEARDKFTGCKIDAGSPTWESIPMTVTALFGFVEGNADVAVVEFDPVLGVVTSVNLDTASGFLSVFVQEVREGHPTGPDEILAEVAAQRAIWEESAITDYQITIRRNCFCPPEFTDPYTVTVSDGAVVSVRRGGAEIELAEFMPATVEDLFDEIADAVFADRLDVVYHPDHGYPVTIDVDPVFNAVDEELFIAVEALVEG
jgi:hypothetical protein